MVATTDSGTQAATLTTEHTLGSSVTTAGIYQLIVNTENLVNDETVTLRIKMKVLTGGTETKTLEATYKHIQGSPVVFSEPVTSMFSVSFTLEQNGGTGRNFEWAVIQLDG